MTYPTFVPSTANLEELVSALEMHTEFCRLTDEIVLTHKYGKKPSRRQLAAQARNARPYVRVLKKLGILGRDRRQLGVGGT